MEETMPLAADDSRRMIAVARQIARQIAEAIEHGRSLDQNGRSLETLGPGLAGASGLALVFEAMRQSGDASADWPGLSKRCLSAGCAAPELPAGLFEGVAGAVVAAKYIARARGGFARFIASLEAHLAAAVRDAQPGEATALRDSHVDLISGIAGIYVALVTTPPSPEAEELRGTIEALLSEPDARLRVMTTAERAAPEACVNLGIAHGLPGIAGAYLGGAVDARVVARVHAYLRAASLPPDGTTWPYQAGSTSPARSAWCYGQPGVPAVLAELAAALGDEAALRHAAQAALLACAGPLRHKGVVDGALCHGTAGIALSLWALGRCAGDEAASTAALHLLTELAQTFRADVRFGYLQWSPYEDRYVEDATLLNGGAGIALAMLTALGRTDPSWVRAFGLSAFPDRRSART